MNLLKNLFSKEPPTENDMLNYVAGQIVLPHSGEAIKAFIQRKYPNSSKEEVSQLEAKCSKIFEFCINIPANDDSYDERVSHQYPFLSKSVIGSLRGKAFMVQERGMG
jgi:hypothetical protein